MTMSLTVSKKSAGRAIKGVTKHERVFPQLVEIQTLVIKEDETEVVEAKG
jgi:hypothetical protein